MFRRRVLPVILFVFYRLLSWTWRLRIVESEAFRQAMDSGKPLVLAHWHGDELALLTLIRRYRVAAMTSTSKDGELMDWLIHALGGRTSRGSSTRGGVSALKGILSITRAGFNPSVAVDGPKGPYHKAKPGVFELSRVLGSPIYPCALSAKPAHVFERSWNKTFLPWPFAKIQVVWGDPVAAVTRDQDPRAPELAAQLEAALSNAKQQSAQLLIASPQAIR